DRADLVHLYVDHFVRAIQLEDLQTLVSLHLARLLRVKSLESALRIRDGRASLTDIARDEVDRLVAANPPLLLGLVQAHLLPVSGLQRSIDADLESTAGDAGVDFLTAYSKVRDPGLGPLAWRWIQAQPLSSGEVKDLGVRISRITEPRDAVTALRF